MRITITRSAHVKLHCRFDEFRSFLRLKSQKAASPDFDKVLYRSTKGEIFRSDKSIMQISALILAIKKVPNK